VYTAAGYNILRLTVVTSVTLVASLLVYVEFYGFSSDCLLLQLIDVFENKEYFQLVMEKHGSGIDMFEFIEKNPHMDERLASYLFRQVGWRLSSYFHLVYYW